MNYLLSHLKAVLQSDLPCAQRMIMLVVLNHADNDSGRAWPSQERIASQCGLGERAVRNHLHELEAAGWLSVIGCRGRNHLYRVSLPAPDAGLKRHDMPDNPQNLRDGQNDKPQYLRDHPANISNQPANRAGETGIFCRLTSQEPPKNYPITTHTGDGPAVSGVEKEHSKDDKSWPETKAPVQAAHPKPTGINEPLKNNIEPSLNTAPTEEDLRAEYLSLIRSLKTGFPVAERIPPREGRVVMPYYADSDLDDDEEGRHLLAA